jgi:hypothetical protein
MDYLKRAVFPYIVLGAVISGLTMVYGKWIGPYIQSGLDKILSYLNLTSASGLGMVISYAVDFLILGALAGGGVYVAQLAGVGIPRVTALNPLSGVREIADEMD